VDGSELCAGLWHAARGESSRCVQLWAAGALYPQSAGDDWVSP
jgi:hypothetical protein